MEDKKVWTTEEVAQLLFNERKRAVEIAYCFYNKHKEEAEIREKIRDDKIGYIKKREADVARLIGNGISGGNALSAVLGETMEDRIQKKMNKYLNNEDTTD